MTKADAVQWVADHSDDDQLDSQQLVEAWEALHERPLEGGDDDDDCVLWSQCVLATETD